MRALYCRDWQPFNDLEIADLPDPTPPEKGLRIRVLAAGVSFAQSLVVQCPRKGNAKTIGYGGAMMLTTRRRKFFGFMWRAWQAAPSCRG